MIAKLSVHPDQIRWYAQSALNGFDTLDKDDAIEHAKSDLRAILAYLAALDRADDPLLVAGVETIKPGVGLEVRPGDSQTGNSADLEVAGLVPV